jgi:single-stranded DNA-binding protein
VCAPPFPPGEGIVDPVAGESMSNVCVLSGRISDYGPKLRPLPSGKWELSFTVCCDEPGRDGQIYTTFIPVLVHGAACEPLAETLEPGDIVHVTGKLSWTKKVSKGEEKSGLAVTTFGVEVLVKAEVSNTVTAELESTVEPEPTTSPPKKGKPHYPKWKPEPAGSVN